jgi:hypothetical protein
MAAMRADLTSRRGNLLLKLALAALVCLTLASCGGLFRSGGTPLPGPTVSPTGTGTPISGTGEGGADPADPDTTTTEEPDFQG